MLMPIRPFLGDQQGGPGLVYGSQHAMFCGPGLQMGIRCPPSSVPVLPSAGLIGGVGAGLSSSSLLFLFSELPSPDRNITLNGPHFSNKLLFFHFLAQSVGFGTSITAPALLLTPSANWIKSQHVVLGDFEPSLNIFSYLFKFHILNEP